MDGSLGQLTRDTDTLTRIKVHPADEQTMFSPNLMMEANVTDSELRQDIIDELEFDPSFRRRARWRCRRQECRQP